VVQPPSTANKPFSRYGEESEMDIVEHRYGDYVISTDKAGLDLTLVHDYLSRTSYWARGRPFDVVQKSVEHSLCFGVYTGRQQVGFARVVTDYATFAWLCDVFVVESHRGRDLGKWLVECVVAHPELQTVGFFTLATRDAHELYRRYGGFQGVEAPDHLMVRGTGRRASS
jgi:GNAT superfamily N-acetyltransferase